MKKIFLLIFALFFVALLGLFLAKDMLAKAAVERGFEQALGMKLSMERLNIGIFNTAINIDQLKIYNPQGYQDQVMFFAPNIYADYSLPQLLRGKIHFNHLRLHLSEFLVARESREQLNLDFLKSVILERKDDPQEEKGDLPQLTADKLELNLGKIVYKDYSRARPTEREFALNFQETYHNVEIPRDLFLILSQALTKTAIPSLAGFDLQEIKDEASAVISESSGVLGERLDQFKEEIKLPLWGK